MLEHALLVCNTSDVFIKHGANKTMCLYLLHRHHTLNAGEAVVKVGGTGHLISAEAIKDITVFIGWCYPSVG